MTAVVRRDATADDDPPPIAPVEPDFDECCGQGCDPCIFDLYEQARERYRIELQAWQERQRKAKSPH